MRMPPEIQKYRHVLSEKIASFAIEEMRATM